MSTGIALTIAVENRRGEDTAQSDAEAYARDCVQAGESDGKVMWSETVSRPTFANGDTTWAIQVTMSVSLPFDADEAEETMEHLESIEFVAVETSA